LQIVLPLQVMFLHAEEYREYLLKDIFDEQARDSLIDRMIDAVLAK